MALVALDTQILIWGGIRNIPRDRTSQPDMVRRARILLNQLNRDRRQIVIPTIVAAELAVPVPSERRGEFLSKLSENFLVKPFDLHAAAIAADLYGRVMKMPKDEVSERKVLQADIKIVATAKAAGVNVFYSHDKKCRRTASLIMHAEDLPIRSDDLFDEAGDPNG